MTALLPPLVERWRERDARDAVFSADEFLRLIGLAADYPAAIDADELLDAADDELRLALYAASPERCPTCGGKRWSDDGPCPTCLPMPEAVTVAQ